MLSLQYIDNSLKTPPTENVLQMFVQNDEATFDKIIQALFRMKRLDVIEEIYTPLSQMVDEIISNYNNETDQGYYSNSSKEKDFLLIKPLHIVNTLPEILKLPNENNGSFKPNDKIISQPSLSLPSLKKPAILITYFDDGKVAAEEILNEIRNMPLEYPVNALCLEDEKLLILSNPEQYIRHFYQEVFHFNIT